MLVAFAGPIANFILALGLMTGVSMLHNEVQEFLDGPAITDYIQSKTPAAKAGIRSGDLIVHFDTVENPTWDDIGNRSVLNLNQTIPFSFVHDGQRTDTKLFIESKGSPDDFSIDQIGFVPKMQQTPVQVSSLEPNMPATRAGLKPGDKILTIDGLQLHSVPALLSLSAGPGRQACLPHHPAHRRQRNRPDPAHPDHSGTRRHSPAARQGLSPRLRRRPSSRQSRAPALRQSHGRLLAVQQEGLPLHR